MARDLSTVAAANTPRLRAESAVLKKGSPEAAAFARAADASVLGTAVKPHKLDLFDRVGEVVGARRISAANPHRDLCRPAEDTYAAEQGRHYPMRTAFEDHWEGGREFVYFALLLDGIAPKKYGDYTLVIDPDACSLSGLACFPGNSAERYASTGVLDVATCEAEASTWSDRGALLVLKHGRSLHPRRAWSAMVCNKKDFSEGVASGTIPVSSVIQVRVRSARLLEWEELRVRFRRKEQLTAEQEQLVRMLDLLDRWEGAGATIVEV